MSGQVEVLNNDAVQAQVLTAKTGEVALSADHKSALSLLGYTYIQHQQTAKALILFEALHTLFPEDAHIIKSLSYLYLKAGRYEQALEATNQFRRHAGADDGLAPVYLIESRALWALARKKQAQQRFQDYTEARKII